VISIILLALIFPQPAFPNSSTFKNEILTWEEIPQPGDPFVTIFFNGGDDSSEYGFTVDGTVTLDDWRQIFRHIGYIAPYAPIKADSVKQWSRYNYDVAVRAAQSLARYSGGSIMGAPTTADARANLLMAYKSPLFLGMTHFFHDDESDPGTPGGNGASRLRISRDHIGIALATPLDQKNSIEIPSEFDLSFGIYVGDYIFGGDATLLTLYNSGDRKSAWVFRFHNEGGYKGINYFEVVTPTGLRLQSVALGFYQAARWQNIRLSVRDATGPRFSSVLWRLGDFGTTTTNIPKVNPTNVSISIGNENGYRRDIDIDDLSLKGAAGQQLATYAFEAPTPAESDMDEFPGFIRDVSGNAHDLAVVGSRAGLHFFPTTGIDKNIAARVKTWLIDDLLDARDRAHSFRPLLLTNWHLGDAPGRFKNWSLLGFDHSSTDYYFGGAPDPTESNLARIFRTRTERTQWGWLDGSVWTHAWLGNATPDISALAPQDYLSLITLAVLDGNRWFSVFTAMSHGHLGLSSDSRRDGALQNADALYDMALAASWFQSTSSSIRNSVYLGDQPLKSQSNPMIFRSRVNPVTREMWFAAAPVAKQVTATRITVTLPATHGILTNLATGERQLVSDGIAQMLVQHIAEPVYFLPMPHDDHP
jgi:hypothetical protein